jgi:hypothetical protein
MVVACSVQTINVVFGTNSPCHDDSCCVEVWYNLQSSAPPDHITPVILILTRQQFHRLVDCCDYLTPLTCPTFNKWLHIHI